MLARRRREAPAAAAATSDRTSPEQDLEDTIVAQLLRQALGDPDKNDEVRLRRDGIVRRRRRLSLCSGGPSARPSRCHCTCTHSIRSRLAPARGRRGENADEAVGPAGGHSGRAVRRSVAHSNGRRTATRRWSSSRADQPVSTSRRRGSSRSAALCFHGGENRNVKPVAAVLPAGQNIPSQKQTNISHGNRSSAALTNFVSQCSARACAIDVGIGLCGQPNSFGCWDGPALDVRARKAQRN